MESEAGHFLFDRGSIETTKFLFGGLGIPLDGKSRCRTWKLPRFFSNQRQPVENGMSQQNSFVIFFTSKGEVILHCLPYLWEGQEAERHRVPQDRVLVRWK